MRERGQLVQWNDARGFGFVQGDAGGGRIFVHISAFQPAPSATRRPRTGMALRYTVGQQSGRPCALAVDWQAQSLQGSRSTVSVPAVSRRDPGPRTCGQRGNAATTSTASSRGFGRYAILGVAGVLCVLLVWQWGGLRHMGWVYGVLSGWSFIQYAHDKRQAQRGGWRTPESTLHSVALLGGWPGALLAQQWLRHKSSKAAFRRIFWCTVGLNLLGLVWLHSPAGRVWWPWT